MQVSVTDTVSLQPSDTTGNIQTDYFIGNIIPIDSSGSSFPDTLVTSDLVYSRVYTDGVRFSGDPIAARAFNSDFGFGMLSFSLILLSLLMILGRKALINSLASLNFKHSYILPVRGTLGALSWAPVITNLFSVLNITLFAIAAGVITGMVGDLPGMETVKYFGILFAGVSVALMLRYMICVITGVLSSHKIAFREYISVISSSWFLTGLTFFLLSFVILFTRYQHPEYAVWLGAGIMTLLYFYRLIRLLIIFIKEHISILYFILYLCALEVLPVLIVIKLLGAF